MPLIKKKTSRNKTTAINNTKFNISISEDERVEFNPNKAFAHITTEQVLKIITKADIEVTKENAKGYVNFKLSSDKKTFGFINFYANDLEDDSSEEHKTEVTLNLEKDLSSVKIADITTPMNAEEADSLIDNL